MQRIIKWSQYFLIFKYGEKSVEVKWMGTKVAFWVEMAEKDIGCPIVYMPLCVAYFSYMVDFAQVFFFVFAVKLAVKMI